MATYKYNKDGIRTEKNVNGVITKYYVEGNKIIYCEMGNNVLYFIYSNNELIGFKVKNSSLNTIANYKYDEKAIYLSLDNSEWGYNIKMKFTNVLYFEVQSCNFWGKGYNLLDWELVDEKKILESLYQRGNYLKASHFNTILEGTSYFATKFLLNSGDEILIYCEKIFVEEKVNN